MQWNKFSTLMPRKEPNDSRVSVDILVKISTWRAFAGYICYSTERMFSYGTDGWASSDEVSFKAWLEDNNSAEWAYIHDQPLDNMFQGVPIDN